MFSIEKDKLCLCIERERDVKKTKTKCKDSPITLIITLLCAHKGKRTSVHQRVCV